MTEQEIYKHLEFLINLNDDELKQVFEQLDIFRQGWEKQKTLEEKAEKYLKDNPGKLYASWMDDTE